MNKTYTLLFKCFLFVLNILAPFLYLGYVNERWCLFSFEFRKFVLFDKNQHCSSVKLSKFFYSNTVVNKNGTCFL